MNVTIEVIPHDQHRYPTVGDWYFADNGDLTIKVSQFGDWRSQMLVAVHELVEVLICKHVGITQSEVDKFDMQFEAQRPEGCDDEPGDDPKAPYRRQHCIAMGVERILAAELGVDWKTYEDTLNDLP